MQDQISAQIPTAAPDLTALTDPELVEAICRAAARERQATADVLRMIIEFDRRQLYLAEGYPSLYAYCTKVLHYSEYAAFNRIEVARAAARWPQLLTSIEEGALHLAGARLLTPHLTDENIELAIASARHKTKREIEDVAAGLARRNLLVAVAAEQYRLHLTISREARDNLRQVQALLSHQVPDVNPAVIFERALNLLLSHLLQQRTGQTSRPRPAQAVRSTSRHIPQAVKREVWKRDGGQCAFVGRQGRCPERLYIEFHHVIPYAAGGEATVDNIELRCRAHNVYEAHTFFGADAVAAACQRREGSARPAGEPVDSQAVTGGADAARTNWDVASGGAAAAPLSGEVGISPTNSPRGKSMGARSGGTARPQVGQGDGDRLDVRDAVTVPGAQPDRAADRHSRGQG